MTGVKKKTEQDGLELKGKGALCTRVKSSDLEEAGSIIENVDITYGNHSSGCTRMYHFHLRRLQGGGVFLQNGFWLRQQNMGVGL